MNAEQTIKLELRLSVLEMLVALLYADRHKLSADPVASLAELRGALLSLAQKTAFPSLGAAYSDLVSQELEAVVAAALDQQKRLLDLPG